MNYREHVIFGLGFAGAVVFFSLSMASLSLGFTTYALFFFLAAFGALVPDLDHPSAKLSLWFHSLLVVSGLVFFYHYLTRAAIPVQYYSAVTTYYIVLTVIAVAVFLIRILDRHRGITHTLFGMVVASSLVIVPAAYSDGLLLPTMGFAVGYFSHLIGDALTPYGVPLLGPWNKRRIRIAWFSDTVQTFIRFVSLLGCGIVFIYSSYHIVSTL